MEVGDPGGGGGENVGGACVKVKLGFYVYTTALINQPKKDEFSTSHIQSSVLNFQSSLQLTMARAYSWFIFIVYGNVQ